MFNSVRLHGHAFYDGKSKEESCSSSSEESSSETLFDSLWNKTVAKIEENFTTSDFCKVANRFGSSAMGTRCIKATHVGGDTNEVHANFVKLGKHIPTVICSQAPTLVSEGAFWKLAVENTHLIVDLTNKGEAEKRDFHAYYPQGHTVYFAGQSRIDLNAADLPPGQFSYTVHLPEQCPQTIERLHFNSWPDFKAVSVAEFDALLSTLEKKQSEYPDRPLWIHCRAGVGRTGTVVVGLALKELHRQGKLTAENSQKVVDHLIIKGRKQRDVYFVQSKVQYKLLLDYIELLLN